MRLHNEGAQLYVPDGIGAEAAIARTTHLAIGAHQDDIPIMAHHGILECFGRDDRWFLGVTVTNGAGSPRAGFYANYTDEEMCEVRIAEERKAGDIGEYGAVALLDYSSAAAKDPDDDTIATELAGLIDAARPRAVYTHNLADKHDTHVAVGLRTIEALRRLPGEALPEAVYGCEVWRDLDWLCDPDKVVFDVTDRENLAAALMGVYDSQVAGGKRYDLAAAGRRLAHATFFESHDVDKAKALIFAMDLTPLVSDRALEPGALVAEHIGRMQEEITDRLTRLSETRT